MDRGAEKRRQSALKINLKSTDGLYMKTVNPCNDFLVDFLIASKLKSQKQGIGKFTTYNLAIQSVRKYPLPLICEAQLAALEGFGDFFINEAAKRIQKHYKRGRLPTPQQIQQDDREHFAALQANRRKGYKKKKRKPQQQQEDENSQQNQQIQQQQQDQQKQESENNNHSSPKKQKAPSSVSSSKKSKKIQNYKPRPQSEPEKILKAMYLLGATQKSISKGQINQIFYNWTKDSVKSWQFCRTRLKQSGFIEFDKIQKDMVRLSRKGYIFIAKRMGRLKNHNDDSKHNLNEKIQKRLLNDPQTKIRIYSFPQSCQLTIILSQKSIMVTQKTIERNLLQDQKQLIKQVLEQEGQHRVDYEQLQGGTFIWQIDKQVLDYIVLRVMINWQLHQDDLQDQEAQTFKNFNKDKFLMAYQAAKFGQFGNITVIVQDQKSEEYEPKSLNQSTKIKQKQYYRKRKEQYRIYVEQIIYQCRAAGIKILHTLNYGETLTYISQVTRTLKQRIDKVKQIGGMSVLGSIESVNKRINKKKMLATLYKRSLRFLIDNKDAAFQMGLKFSTFKNTEAKIIRNSFDQTTQSKRRVLKNLFKNCKVKVDDQTIDTIIRFFFSQSYSQ